MFAPGSQGMRQKNNKWDSLYEMPRVIVNNKATGRHYREDLISDAYLAFARGVDNPLEPRTPSARHCARTGPLPPLQAILRGSLVERYKQCGKPGSKCADGPGAWPKYYLSVSYPGLRPQMDYAPWLTDRAFTRNQGRICCDGSGL
jgi:hypothetical protein